MRDWTTDDLRAWRARMRWTQAQAASALYYHLEAYKRLELGTRVIVPRIARLATLTEREHVRALVSASGAPGQRQAFATPQRVIGRLEALALEGRLTRKDGRRRLRYVSLFSGIEGATAALERIGADALPLAFSEIDPVANAILRYRWPDVPRIGDIMEFDWASLRGQTDLVAGGPPCQSFSVAGRRLGLRDPRGHLALHFLRTVSVIQPRWFVFENVFGMLSSAGGADFEVFLSAVEDIGYSCAWRILDARHFGLPQRRRRLWIVGEHSGSASGPGAVLALDDGQAGHSAPRRPAWKKAAGRAQEITRDLNSEEDVDWSLADSWLRGRTASATDCDPTSVQSLAAEGSPDQGLAFAADMRHGTLSSEAPTIQVGPSSGWSLHATPCVVQQQGDGWLARRFSPRECLRLQGFDDDWLDGVKFGGQPLTDSDRYRLVGNAWSVPTAAWVLERLLANHDKEDASAASGSARAGEAGSHG